MKTIKLYTPNCITTVTGICVNVFEPTIEMICIEDIAHALSHQCRFGGHIPRFYSVAEHSVICSEMVDEKSQFVALMHDASEAYLLDIPSPIKSGLSNYKEMELKLMNVIAKKFGFEWPMNKDVEAIDKRMLEAEWDHIMLEKNHLRFIQCLPSLTAKEKFIERFNYLSTKNKYKL